LGGDDVCDAPLDVLQRGELLLVGVVERLARVLRPVEQSVELRPDELSGTGQQTHLQFLLVAGMPVAYRRARRTESPSQVPLERLPRGGRAGRGRLLRGFRRSAGAAAGRGREVGGGGARRAAPPFAWPQCT